MHVNQDTKFLELIRSNKQRVYDFLFLMLPDKAEVEDLMVDIFRRFGANKMANPSEIDLFILAWRKLQTSLRNEAPQISFGRDIRVLSSFDENLLDLKGLDTEKQTLLNKRLCTVDADFRAPVILKDILKFEDEEILKILKVRWGVYRHRLHRGRLEIKDALKGKSSPAFSLTETEIGNLT